MTREKQSTTCATITGSGRSAIAVVGVRGCEAAEIVSRCFHGVTKGPFSPQGIRYGNWRGVDDESTAGESVVVTQLADESFEIHCHGGRAAVARIIEDLAACGAEPISADQWSRAADQLLIHEAKRVLARCLTPRTAAIAMDQSRGALAAWARGLLEGIASERISIDAVREDAHEILRWSPLTTRLGDPFRVVLVGPPNVGKSSLLNAIVGFDRSITFDAAGTTRDVLHADTIIDGLPIRLSDTAGIRLSDQEIEQQGIERAQLAARQADLVVCVRQPDQAGEPLSDTPAAVIHVLNKVDLADNGGAVEAGEIATCALTGQGIDGLMTAISERLADWPPPGAAVAINERQQRLIGEIAESQDQELAAAKLRELMGSVL